MPVKPRTSINDQLQVVRHQLESLHAEIAQALLDGADVTSLEAERTSLEGRIRSLQAAAQAERDRASAAGRKADGAALRAARELVDVAGQRQRAVILALVQKIEGLAPLAAELQALSNERRAAAITVAKRTRQRDGLSFTLSAGDLASQRDKTAPHVVAAALWRSGLAQALHLESAGIQITPPLSTSPLAKGDLLEATGAMLDRDDQRLATMLDGVLSTLGVR